MFELLHGAGDFIQSMDCGMTVSGAQWLDRTIACMSQGPIPVNDQAVVLPTLRSEISTSSSH